MAAGPLVFHLEVIVDVIHDHLVLPFIKGPKSKNVGMQRIEKLKGHGVGDIDDLVAFDVFHVGDGLIGAPRGHNRQDLIPGDELFVYWREIGCFE